MKINKADLMRTTGTAALVLAAAVIGLSLVAMLSACNAHDPERTWVDTHPTHAGINGECIEYDGELCDDDPYDLDDLFEKAKPSSKSSKRPSPAPVRRTPAPRKTR